MQQLQQLIQSNTIYVAETLTILGIVALAAYIMYNLGLFNIFLKK